MALGIPGHQIRVIQPYVGGGFGGKIYMQPHFPISALLSRKARKPVRISYTRKEDFISSRPRISEIIDLRLGFKKDGTIIAKNVVITADAGAYIGAAPNIVTTSMTRSDGVYRLPNIKAVANIVYTNKIPRSPFRGFGNPEMLFAMESLIDIAAEKLGIDPAELRLKNATQSGDITVHGWIIKSCGLSESIKLATEQSDWKVKTQNRTGNRGIGIACQVHSAGNRAATRAFSYDGSAAIVNVDQDGKVRVISGETDLGQGMRTVFAQIAAEEIGVGIGDVEVVPFVDTDIAPFCFGTFADRVTVLGGNAVLMAARDARNQLQGYAAEKLQVNTGDLEMKSGKFYVRDSPEKKVALNEVAREAVFDKRFGMPITGRGEFRVPDYVVLPDENKYGNYSLSYSYGAAVAEVSVDRETGKVNVLNIWYAQNIGKALNPKLCEGQVEGGVVQGMGYALSENYYWEGGRVLNPNFTDYKIPTAQTSPAIHCVWVEQPNPGSPYGAKGIGEPVLNPVAPAIANAIYNAVGVRIKSLPITSEKILKALKEKIR
jgi:CO/xanthine dehydrogenase Mo-binding subunit